MKERLARLPRGAVVAALVSALVVAGGASFAAGLISATPAQPVPSPTPIPKLRALPALIPPPSHVRSCSVASLAADPQLGQMQAQVRHASSGEVLFDRGGQQASRPASVLKVLTAAAALDVLGPDYRATTSVVKGAEPGSIVLVGGGDLTLARNGSNVYPGAASLPDLANRALAAYNADPSLPPLTTLVLDSSFFSGDEWQPSWNIKELYDGYISKVTALQVDGDRDNPGSNTSTRSEDPISRAGEAFSDALGGGLTIVRGSAPAGAAVLATAESPTVAQLIDKSLIVSDNTAAEMLARLVAIRAGSGNSFGAIQGGAVGALANYGIDTSGIQMVDGSGLSDNNAVSPNYLTQLFQKVYAREGHLGTIYDSLPVAGQRGSLSYSDRFTGDNSVADGAVYAKTGWIDTGYTLAGIVIAADGTPLTFAIYALGDVDESAKNAIDTFVAGVYRCGNELSQH